jgi:hypothetical protein
VIVDVVQQAVAHPLLAAAQFTTGGADTAAIDPAAMVSR